MVYERLSHEPENKHQLRAEELRIKARLAREAAEQAEREYRDFERSSHTIGRRAVSAYSGYEDGFDFNRVPIDPMDLLQCDSCE